MHSYYDERATRAASSETIHLVQDGMLMYCQIFWQRASARQKRKYPRYALSGREFERRHREYQEERLLGKRLSFEQVTEILDDLVSITDVYRDIEDVRNVGEILRYASFALCLVGAPASVGDLECFVRAMFEADEWDEDQATVLDLWRWRDEGDPVPLIRYLNSFLEFASESVQALAVQRKDTVLRPLQYDPVQEKVAVDKEVVLTQYLLYVSLLQLVEPEAGHA